MKVYHAVDLFHDLKIIHGIFPWRGTVCPWDGVWSISVWKHEKWVCGIPKCNAKRGLFVCSVVSPCLCQLKWFYNNIHSLSLFESALCVNTQSSLKHIKYCSITIKSVDLFTCHIAWRAHRVCHLVSTSIITIQQVVTLLLHFYCLYSVPSLLLLTLLLTTIYNIFGSFVPFTTHYHLATPYRSLDIQYLRPTLMNFISFI